ncbi:hypothetical protein GSI_12042 [Ganoderma sinense ZZ0214-1]|uniref:Uncharacterized protein n=1 Tax=Ganoderma sinense ZZ0214-1 TaxID=1077348 RepID=A0A2G8RXP2_9APHY|nr:hypothetical protein GSI_12042 [Ganoderma sinense ZZ0214-1]
MDPTLSTTLPPSNSTATNRAVSVTRKSLTDRAELHYFHGPENVPGGYAILSHVWEGQEQTFKEIQDLRAECAKSGQNPRDLASPKVRACCTIAARHGYRWIWNDTCCINKESSAELSEAINSMFRYYSLATICYAYLYDVPRASRSALEDADSPFRKSRWHTRGWTLQELIAPRLIVFLSDDWEMLGTKMELAELLEEITNVPVAVLRLAQAVHDFSVACRMSWASNRETTRSEDMAYCLLGIFSINMPTLYGEGERAFLRLQEEIMKQSFDASLFVWEDPGSMDQNVFVRREIHAKLPDDTCYHTLSDRYFLLAKSPKSFFRSKAVSFSPALIDGVGQALDTNTPSFSVTPYGIRAQIPVIDGPNFSVAMLCCMDGTKQTIGLVLTACQSPPDPSRDLYHTAWNQRVWRTVLLGEDFANPRLFGEPVSPEWRDIYIADRPPPAPASILSTPSDYTLSPPFRFPMQELEKCLGTYGALVHVSQRQFGWAGSPPVVFTFEHKFVFATIYVAFGRCSSGSSRSLGRGPLWASVLFDTGTRHVKPSADGVVPRHDCGEHHIANWPDSSRMFTGKCKNGDILLTLSFGEDALSPTETFVPHIKHHVEVRSMIGPGVVSWKSDSDHAARPGATVFAVVRNPAGSTHLNAAVKDLQNVHVVKADVVDHASLKDAAKLVSGITGGKLDVLIHVAAKMDIPGVMRGFDDFPNMAELDAEFIDAYKVNALGPVHSITAFLPLLRASSTKKIVVISSGGADPNFVRAVEVATMSAYGMTKAAALMATTKFALKLKDEGFIVCSLSPGLVDVSGTIGESGSPELRAATAPIADMWTQKYGISVTFQSPQESVSMQLKVIDELKPSDNGLFLSHEGGEWVVPLINNA